MKKSLLVLTFLVLFLGTFTDIWAETKTIGTGTNTGRYPLNDYFAYSRSQCLYLQSEIGMTSGTITKLRWYRDDIGADPNAIVTTSIWLIETTSTTLSGTSWISPGTSVATISNIDLGSGGGWYEIDITDFQYFGGNLLVSVRTQNAPYTTPHSYWRYTSTPSNMMLAGNSDGTNPPNVSTSTSRPNIQMDIEPLTGYPGIVTTPNPADASTGIALSGDLNWTFGADTSTYDLWFGPTGSMLKVVDNQTAGATGTYPYTGLSADTEYSWQVISRNATKAVTNGPVWKFRTALPAGLVQIGNGTVTSNNLPINPFYGYSYSQVIYLQSEINVPDQRISKLKYYWNGLAAGTNSASWTVYMGHTTKTAFSSTTDWIPTSAMTQVYSGNVTLPASAGWVEITLSTPFNYNNAQNLVIAVDENTAGDDGSSAKFFGSAVSAARSLLFYNDSTNPDPAAPPTTGYTLVSNSAIANIRLQFEDIPAGPFFSYSPSALNFNNVAVGASSAWQNVTVTNTGGPTLNLSATDIDIIGTDATQFSFDPVNLPASLAANGTVQIPVRFSPGSLGAKTATLRMTWAAKADYDVALSGTGVLPFVNMATGSKTLALGESWNFYDSGGASATYSASENYTYTFYPPAGYLVQVTFSSFASESGYDFLRIYNGASTSDPLLGTYSGTATIPQFTSTSGALTFNFTSDSGLQYAGWAAVISLIEVPTNPSYSISPTTWDFVDTDTNTTDSQTFRVSNTGGGSLGIVSVAKTAGDMDYFAITNNTYTAPLGQGDYFEFDVEFTPTAVQDYTVTITITDDQTKIAHELVVTGNGITRPAGSTCENPYFVTLPLTGFTGDTALYGDDYESTWITPSSSYMNGDDMVLQFTLAEDSAVSGVLTATTGTWIGMFILNTPPDPATPAPVLASATSTGTVATLAETILPAGTYYLILSTYPDPQSFQFSLDLNAVALDADPIFTISPTSYDYQNVYIGSPVAQDFRITNTGGGTLTIAMADIDIIGDNFDQFDLTPLTEDISLGRNAWKDITVTFDPSTVGAKYASIQIVHNAAAKATASVPLTGTALEAPFFIENLDGETIGQLPSGWTQEGTHWSVYNTNYAGGTAPEMRFYYSPRETGTYRLISPALTSASGALTISYKHYIDYYNTPATYKVQYSTDGSNWVDIWSMVDPITNVGPATVQIALPPTSGTFYLAWMYYGDSYNTDNWYVDDISITREDENVPVEFSSFTATLTADMYVQLTWVTQSETNMNGYYVLRSSNDNLVNAQTISALIPASGTSETHSYQYQDSELVDVGTYYYWLECVEQGSSTYHGPISVTWDNSFVPPAEIPVFTALNAIYPNPFNPIAYIPYSIGKEEKSSAVSFRIYNSRGQMVYSETLPAKAAGTNYNDYFWDGRDSNGNSCATGVYFIRMTVGKNSYMRKAVLVK